MEYLVDLGVTAVELLPVHAFLSEDRLRELGLSNYWGYNSLGYFALAPRYSATGRLSEFRHLVERLHEAGIEVILDVVYNHTAEGNHLGPTLCFRGIDNATYYRLDSEDLRYYVNDSGCGNTLNMAHPQVRTMVLDSLRYWAGDMGVDGFRIDLASALCREPHGFDTWGGFMDALRQDPLLTGTKLIAEPWDLGPLGYRLGQFRETLD